MLPDKHINVKWANVAQPRKQVVAEYSWVTDDKVTLLTSEFVPAKRNGWQRVRRAMDNEKT